MKRSRLLTALLLLAGLSLQAQETTISPYSRLSIGEVPGPTFSRNFAMGGLGYALTDAGYLNPFNPASLTDIKWTCFEIGVMAKNSWLESGSQTQNGNVIGFNHLVLGFPITRWWGASLGIMPVSKVGYSYSTSHALISEYNSIPYQNIFDGQGGLNQIFMSHGFKIKKKLSLGFNFAYYFGKMEYQEVQSFNNLEQFNNTAYVNKTESGGIHFDLGAQYLFKLNDIWDMNLGLVFTPQQGLSSNTSEFGFTYTGTSGVPRIIDTISYAENASFSIALPPKIGVGVLFMKSNKLQTGIDFDYVRWSVSNFNTYKGLDDVINLRAGGEYRFGDGGYKLRLGARFGEVPYRLGGKNPLEYAGTIGCSVPFRTKDKLSYTEINIGVEVGQRGQNSGEMILEKFITFHFGVTLNNKWFIKRVYD